jgi:hypothetical protein
MSIFMLLYIKKSTGKTTFTNNIKKITLKGAVVLYELTTDL